jgi:hypothetical protein
MIKDLLHIGIAFYDLLEKTDLFGIEISPVDKN